MFVRLEPEKSSRTPHRFVLPPVDDMTKRSGPHVPRPKIGLAWPGHPWSAPPRRTRPLLSNGVVLRNLQRALESFAGEVRPWQGDRDATASELDAHLEGLDLLVCDAYGQSEPFLQRRLQQDQRWRALILAHGNMPKAGDPLFTLRPHQVRPGDGILFTSTADHAIWRQVVNASRVVERVIPLPVDDATFRTDPTPSDPGVRERFGIPSDRLLLLYVGRVNIQKNVHGLLDLLAEVRVAHPDVQLACVGEPDETWLAEFRVANAGYLDLLHRRAEALGVADAVHFVGPAFGEDLAALYRTADVVVNLSFYHRENFGLSQAEAQACGTPVVCSAWGGFRDVVVDGKTGVLADAVLTRNGIRVNWADAAHAVSTLLGDPEERRTMGEAAAERARSEHSISTFAEQLRAAVADTLGAGRDGGEAFEATPLARRYLEHATAHGWSDPDDDGWESPMYQGGDYEIYKALLGPYASGAAENAEAADLRADTIPYPASPWDLDDTRRLLSDLDPVWPHRRFVPAGDWQIVTRIDGRATVAEVAIAARVDAAEVRRVITHLHHEGFVLFRRHPPHAIEVRDYDDIVHGYLAHVESSVIHGVAFSALLPLCAPAGRVLDLGCGEGILARALAQKGNTVTGVDVSGGLLAVAHAREQRDPLGITYVRVNAATLEGFDDGSFDGVATSITFTDLADLEGVLRAVERVLVPGGWFAFAALHPCFEPPHARTAEIDGRLVRQVNRYFEEGTWRSRNADSLIAVRHHRRLSTILNAVIDAGLVIERFEEPKGDASAIARAPIYGEVAEVLVAKAVKPEGRAIATPRRA